MDEERIQEKTLSAEEILAIIGMDEIAAPLVEVFKGEAVPESIRVYGEGVIGESKDPDTQVIIKLGGGRDSGTLEFYFGTMDVLGQRGQEHFYVPNASVHVHQPSYHRFLVQSSLYMSRDFDLSYPSAKGLLRILQEVSSRYVALNDLRRERWIKES